MREQHKTVNKMPRVEVPPPSLDLTGVQSEGREPQQVIALSFCVGHVMLTMLAFRPVRQLQHPALS